MSSKRSQQLFNKKTKDDKKINNKTTLTDCVTYFFLFYLIK